MNFLLGVSTTAAVSVAVAASHRRVAPSSGDLGGWDSSTHGGGVGGGGGFEAGGSALQRSVSRLFQERVQYFAGVTFLRGSILAGGWQDRGPDSKPCLSHYCEELFFTESKPM